jgi:beta-N-acetylhexosaminidase
VGQVRGALLGSCTRYLAAMFVALALLSSGGAPGVASPAKGAAARGDQIQSKIRAMTLEEKVGQMFTLQVFGRSAKDEDPTVVAGNQELYGVDTIQEVVDKYKPGGITYFAGGKDTRGKDIPNNVGNPRQIAGLSNGIQKAATKQPARIPMLISTDQEQGLVVRVTEPATQFPGSMALGAARNTDHAEQAAQITGAELRAMGINQNFAPVADVNVNPENPVIGIRSFGSTPDLVAPLTAAQVGGYQENVAATAKHFPGHGDTDTDSHTGLPIIDHSRTEIEEIDLPPFRSAIRSGVDVVMTAHIVVPALDDSGCPDLCRPATLSEPILTGVLREELGYKGVVTTDALNMDALQEFGEERIPVEAIEAGADVLLMPKKMDVAYNAVLGAVRSGEIPERRIDESVERILKLKQERGLFKNPYVNRGLVKKVVGTPQHLATARSITDKTVTLVKNDSGTLPLEGKSGKRVLVVGRWETFAGSSPLNSLAKGMSAQGVATETLVTGDNPNQAKIGEAVSQARNYDLVVVETAYADYWVGQQNLVKALLDTGKPVIVVAMWNPYDIAYFDEADTYLATYGFRSVSMEALARVLFGEVNPTGKLPVSIPAANDPDTVLYPYGHGLSY